MDATKLLIGDHNRVKGLFSRFNEAEEKQDTATMQQLAGQIAEELHVHTQVEEQVFYPGVRGADDSIEELVAEGLEEHHVVDQLIEELGGVEAGGEQWTAKLKVLMENVEHHVEEEEGEMFPKVRSKVGNQELEALAAQMSAKKRELGAPTLADAIDLTKEKLLEKAREQDIPGRSSMSHEELAAAVDPR